VPKGEGKRAHAVTHALFHDCSSSERLPRDSSTRNSTKQPASVVYSLTCYTSSCVGSSAVRKSLNCTLAYSLIKRELLFIQRMKGCR